MVGKEQWVVLPYSLSKDLMGLRLSPPGVKEDFYWRPKWVNDYSYSNINTDTLPIALLSAIQYGRVLDRLIRDAPPMGTGKLVRILPGCIS